MSNTTPIIEKRKILKIGGSYYIKLPKEFLESNEISEDDEVGLIANQDILLTRDNEVVDKINKELHEHTHKKIKELFKY